MVISDREMLKVVTTDRKMATRPPDPPRQGPPPHGRPAEDEDTDYAAF
jgi:hypothetical protein